MYKQTIQNIKVVILPLDGVIFDLNRFRYNYCQHLCKSQQLKMTKEEFYNHLSNMYDMYKELPFSPYVETGPFNARIERELSQYLHYKGLKPKEGLLELIEYLHQKNIKIAALTTHHTKNAVEYLKLTNLYKYFHFIVGSDTSSLPLPSTQILETIKDFFEVESKDVLVISPFFTLNQTAHQLQMNIIYVEDLMVAGPKEKATSYKTVSNLFEVLNCLLFDRYNDAEMYSSILGMDENMSQDQITDVYNNLMNTYKNDPQIIELINQTYEYYIAHLQQHNVKDASIIETSHHVKHFSFQDDTKKEIESNIDIHTEEQNEIIEEKHIEQHTTNSREDDELISLLSQIKQKEIKNKKTMDENASIQENPFLKEDDTSWEEEVFVKSENDELEEYKFSIMNVLTNMIYILSISFLILFVGIIISVVFIHQLTSPTGIFKIIVSIFNGYNIIVDKVFAFIFDSLSLLPFIPTYTNYCQSMSFFSVEGLQLFHIFIFNSIVIGLIKGLWFLIQRRYLIENTEQD
ncbi:MAG: HAD hydrolase-like protein [Erysipelotrichales bacterium]|nr:HAD hydrolase-like protein [Erysipelotrichales bacterium]